MYYCQLLQNLLTLAINNCNLTCAQWYYYMIDDITCTYANRLVDEGITLDESETMRLSESIFIAQKEPKAK